MTSTGTSNNFSSEGSLAVRMDTEWIYNEGGHEMQSLK